MQQETFLPVFPGFYGTIFEPYLIEDDENYHLSEDCLEGEPFDYDSAAKRMCQCIENKLRDEGFELRVHYQQIVSPREYNFRNDSIDVLMLLSEDCLTKIRQTLSDNIAGFVTFIKGRYTSKPGFISYYPNDLDGWGLFHRDKHMLGAVLDFILLHVFDYGEEDLYNDLTYFGEHMQYYERVKTEFEEILNQIDSYIRDNYLKTDREQMASALYTNFGENMEYECTFDPDFFTHMTNKVYNEIEDKVGKLF